MAIKSPYAAEIAKAPGKSGATTPGIKNAKPMNRKECKMSIGRRAARRGWRRSWPEVVGCEDPPGRETERDAESEEG